MLTFSPTGTTELQKNTALALYLLRYLEHQRDPLNRLWVGPRWVRTLQFTCHCLEALHHLQLRGLTEHLRDPATRWLLRPEFDAPPEDQQLMRIYPSRFKTLLMLGAFEADQLLPEVEALARYFDPVTGWLSNAPVDLHPTLVTLIWTDTLLHLQAQQLLLPARAVGLQQALTSIAQALENWLDQAALALQKNTFPADSPSHQSGVITNAGDASYAFDLLLRGDYWTPTAPHATEAAQLFTELVQRRRLGDLRRTDLLYSSLHLRTHCATQPGAQDAVQSFLAEIRGRYESDDAQREPLPYHALVLRVLVAHHGAQLADQVLKKLWHDTLEADYAQERHAQEQQLAEFVQVIQQSIHIQLAPPQRITGTRAQVEVYRLRFGLQTEATDENDRPFTVPRETLRLIVKKGAPTSLQRAMERYRALPEKLQQLFARHVAEPRTPGYLLMQDLADMSPLSECLTELERPSLMLDEREQLATTAAQSVGRILQALHQHDRRPVIASYQFESHYITPITTCLERLCQPKAFPELKQWLEGTLLINELAHKKFDTYLTQLRRHETQLRPPRLGYVHGDCHSRNLMLTRDYARAKFVDIDTLTNAEDYILDYGLLLEDVAVYQALPYGSERGRLEWDLIETSRPTNTSRSLENWITYPPFPQSEAIVIFQRELLRQLQDYAERLQDTGWQSRLWLAIARGLMLLAARQLASHTVEPLRRSDGAKLVNDIKLVQVAYAEALRLLRELLEHLKQTQPLPTLPFPGLHRSLTPLSPTTGGNWLSELRDAIGQAFQGQAEWQAVEHTPFVDLVANAHQQAFARLNTKPEAPALYLLAQRNHLNDPQHLAQASILQDEVARLKPAGFLATRIRLTPYLVASDILDLLRQTLAHLGT